MSYCTGPQAPNFAKNEGAEQRRTDYRAGFSACPCCLQGGSANLGDQSQCSEWYTSLLFSHTLYEFAKACKATGRPEEALKNTTLHNKTHNNTQQYTTFLNFFAATRARF